MSTGRLWDLAGVFNRSRKSEAKAALALEDLVKEAFKEGESALLIRAAVKRVSHNLTEARLGAGAARLLNLPANQLSEMLRHLRAWHAHEYFANIGKVVSYKEGTALAMPLNRIAFLSEIIDGSPDQITKAIIKAEHAAQEQLVSGAVLASQQLDEISVDCHHLIESRFYEVFADAFQSKLGWNKKNEMAAVLTSTAMHNRSMKQVAAQFKITSGAESIASVPHVTNTLQALLLKPGGAAAKKLEVVATLAEVTDPTKQALRLGGQSAGDLAAAVEKGVVFAIEPPATTASDLAGVLLPIYEKHFKELVSPSVRTALTEITEKLK